MKNIEILRFEFIDTDYPQDKKYVHWSRIYEWKYVIDHVTKTKPTSIHNTSCGGLNINDTLHLTFCDDLDNLCNNVTHSDIWGGSYPGTEKKPDKNNFVFYDIREKLDKKYDLVLNISTLEHLNKEDIEISINNLIDQINHGGEMILTFDYPFIDINFIENLFKTKINFSEKENIRFSNLMVVILHIKKI